MAPNLCKTVIVKGVASEQNPSGNVVINEEDFDPETMELVEPVFEQVAQNAPAPAPKAPAKASGKSVAPWAATN